MKSSTMFVCSECGYETSSWLGKCPECGVWNSLKEFQVKSKIKASNFTKVSMGKSADKQNSLVPKNLNEVVYEEKSRIKTGFLEMDGVLGGGIVGGSVVLLAGDPGIGKSTLLLQTALNISGALRLSRSPTPVQQASSSFGLRSKSPPSIKNNHSKSSPHPSTILYISGEESEEQIKLRAQRIKGYENNNLLLLSATDTDAIIEVISMVKPSLVIIDSIQTIESENLEGLAGSVGQVRYGAFSFVKLAKQLKIPIIIVGHVTKEGMVAGPMILSHMVDVVLFLEGEKTTGTRILRSFKNRFGPVDEVGIFAMEQEGLREVKNPESLFLAQDERKNVPGSVLVVTIEGTRAFLVELQALVVFSKLPLPRRVVSGIDAKRLELLAAVLQKHCKIPLDTMDIFVNVAGGLKISDRAIDLGICLALFSSFKNIPLSRTVGISEVGLLGELRNVPFLEKRVKEANKLGFRDIISIGKYKTLNEVIKLYG